MPDLPGISTEQLAELNRVTALQRQASTIGSPIQAARLTSLLRAYPNMSPGLSYALAGIGQGPGPLARQLWQADTQRQLGQRPGTRLDKDGNPLAPDNQFRRRATRALQVKEGVGSQIELTRPPKNLLHAPLATLADAISESIQNQDLTGFKQAVSAAVTNLGDVTTTGARRKLAKAGFDPAIRRIVMTQMQSGAPTGGVFEAVMDIPRVVTAPLRAGLEATGLEGVTTPIKGVTRAAGVGLEAGYQALQGALRVGPQGPLDFGLNPSTRQLGQPSLSDPLAPFKATVEQTTAYQAANQLAHGEDVDLGSGFFPAQGSRTEELQAEAARRYSPYLINGHAWTPGRQVADWVSGIAPGHVFEPDDPGFNVVSGLVDASIAMSNLDPAAFALKGLAGLNQTRKILDILPLTTEERIASLEGQRLTENLASATTHDAVNAAAGFEVEPSLAQRLIVTDTPTGAANVLRHEAEQRGLTNINPAEYANAGAIKGWRSIFHPKYFDTWIQQPRQQQMISKITEEQDPAQVVRAFGWKVGFDRARQFAATQSDAETMDVLRDAVQHREFTNTFKYKPPRSLGFIDDMRAIVPHRLLDARNDGDMQLSGLNADRFLETARVPMAKRNEVLNMWIHANNPIDRYQAVNATFETLHVALRNAGMDAKTAKEFTRFEQSALAELSDYGAVRAGDVLAGGDYVRAGMHPDQEIPLNHAITDNQLGLNRWVEMPDPHMIRRETATGIHRMIVRNPGVISATAAADALMSGWKKAILFRPAWGLRVVGEEQARIAAYGHVSLFNHPLTAIALAMGDPEHHWLAKMDEWTLTHLHTPEQLAEMKSIENKLSLANLDDIEHARLEARLDELKATEKLGGRANRAVTDRIRRFEQTHASHVTGVTGVPFGLDYEDDPFRMSLYSTNSRAAGEERRINMREFATTPSYNPDGTVSELGPRATVEELAMMSQSKLAKGYLNALSPEEAKQAFWDGDLSPTRLWMSRDHALAKLNDEDINIARAASDDQINQVASRLRVIHNDQPILVEAARTGKIDGIPLVRDGKTNPDAIEKMRELADDGIVQLAPQMRIRKWFTLSETDRQANLRALKHTFDSVFESFMLRPSNYWSRGPFTRQEYWSESRRLFPYAPRAERQSILDKIDSANLPATDVAELRGIHARLNELGDADHMVLSAAEIDHLAGQHALRETKELLYDLSQRGRLMDQLRLIFPFGEAFKEVATRWYGLVRTHPEVVRRMQQIVTGARSPGSGAINELLGGHDFNRPFFHQNEFGEEVMSYPGSEQLTKAVFGANLPGLPSVPGGMGIPLEGQVQGLNMMGNLLPGVGPLVQLPLSYALPDKPQFETIRDLIFPYGAPTGGPVERVLGAAEPTWMRRLDAAFRDPDSDRKFMSAVADASNHLAATGEYALQGPNARAETSRLMKDAKTMAQKLYLVQAFGAATLPASPRAEWITQDKSGRAVLVATLNKWFNKRTEDVGYNNAVGDFFNKFGTGNFLTLQPKSIAEHPTPPLTVDSHRWVTTHPELKDRYPNVYGLFAPKGNVNDYSNEEYERQLAKGERTALNVSRRVQLANGRLASYAYKIASQKLAGEADKYPKGTHAHAVAQANISDELSRLRADLVEQFPGYDPGGSHYKSTPVLIEELTQAANDPLIRRTPGGRALRTYLAQRDQAIAVAQNAGYKGFQTANATQPLRDKLNEWGAYLIKKHPEFQPIWDAVLSREVE